MYIVVSLQILTTLHQMTEAYGGWGSWGGWSACSVTCGFGSVKRSRNWIFANGTVYKNFTYFDTLGCNTNRSCPIHGGWNVWTAWSQCTQLCGNGTSFRTRVCNLPKPVNDGMLCNGTGVATRRCNERICPELPTDFDMSKCNLTSFICDSKLQCIRMDQRCDDEVQCHDGTDEKDCSMYLYMNSNGVAYGSRRTIFLYMTLITLILYCVLYDVDI